MIWRWRRPRVSIRRLLAADAVNWRDLRLEALSLHPEAYGSTHDDWAGAPLSAFADRLGAGIILGAFHGDDLVGSTALDAVPSAPERCEITAVYVKSNVRGQGVARALLRETVVQAKAREFDALVLSVATTNQQALRLYQAAGFRSAGQEPRALARNGQILDLIRMVRRIKA